jgi:peptidoglycan-associated lipoprotein
VSLTEDELFARKTLEELNAERPLGDAFFDYDQYTIRSDSRAVLQQNAEWLRRWTSTRVTIEGHCDSRGTSEYNLALGERRGHAVREYLLSLGVEGDRLFVVSKGEESPVCFEEHESCWQQNRRAHPIITAK